ncbi:MAG: VOC family protein [Pseudonocardiaceae bacterium]
MGPRREVAGQPSFWGSDERKAAAQARCEQLTAHGARFLRELDEPTGWCLVLADPEGYEFCLHCLVRRTATYSGPRNLTTVLRRDPPRERFMKSRKVASTPYGMPSSQQRS